MPPPPIPRVPESVGVKVKVPPLFVMEKSFPVVDVAKVMAPVCAEPDDWARERRPVFESVVPPRERPEPMESVPTCEVPAPIKMPERVVEPVPPLATPKVPVTALLFARSSAPHA